ncbi:hypothetical protein [Paenibacillus xylaniclasticus]|uniref:hypothetical protein n=1 Tax=Paenibacillus xylaniclasticus TaxID=588083 RepID=UPI000FDCA93C|nr:MULTISPECIES: hypothetical protein [Paenibacillus]GFN30946.1 hypothetical protein PCURB6_12060 [Paenibacillus curdlanolyticus]
MKTTQATPAQFQARFGSDRIVPGRFSYFICDNGMGIIRDDNKRTLEIISDSQLDDTELTPEDELILMSLVCGDFQEEIEVPAVDSLFMYEERELKSRRSLHLIRYAIFLIVAACLVACIAAFILIV